MKNMMIAFMIGALFSLGLLISGMTKPSKVIGFLDVFGQWDPSLMFVMLGGIGSHLILYRMIIRRQSPMLDDRFHISPMKTIDWKLISGSAIFGIGWGLGGFCPGPGIVGMLVSKNTLIFAGTMILGMFLYEQLIKMWNRHHP